MDLETKTIYTSAAQPPFCPNSECPEHHQTEGNSTEWFIRRGFYHTKTKGLVQRFRCKRCRRSFTARIFTLDYYAKRVDVDFADMLFHYCNGFSQRALAEHFHCSTRTIAQRLQILSRQSMAAILEANNHIQLAEDLAIDGMQNFTGSQYQPNNYNIIVGQYSQYLSMENQVIFSRGGNMTPYQKKMKKHYNLIGHWKRSDFAKSIEELIESVFTIVNSRADKKHCIVCNSDKKPLYIRCIQKHPGLKELTERGLFSHVETSSKCFRNIQNPLFPVNYIDNRLRNDLADWQRETTSFPRETNRNFQRFLCYAAYHDFFRTHRARKDSRSHAEVAGLEKHLVEKIKNRFYLHRAFKSKLTLPHQWEESWFCRLITPLMLRNGIPFNGNRPPGYLTL